MLIEKNRRVVTITKRKYISNSKAEYHYWITKNGAGNAGKRLQDNGWRINQQNNHDVFRLKPLARFPSQTQSTQNLPRKSKPYSIKWPGVIFSPLKYLAVKYEQEYLNKQGKIIIIHQKFFRTKGLRNKQHVRKSKWCYNR
jgi:hypothetical protein